MRKANSRRKAIKRIQRWIARKSKLLKRGTAVTISVGVRHLFKIK